MAASDRNYTLKKSQLFINFPLTCLKNLKFLEARGKKKLFYLKYSFSLPLDSAVPGRLHHSPTPPPLATPLWYCLSACLSRA